ncbi:MAG: cation:proton antiporter [Candidatus Omnitrophica bacterium]|nr:cation:proton antiporter [Candidatus Omnitrophota bacterium]
MEKFIPDLGVVLVAAALLSFLAIIIKQPIIIAYIVSGILIGPWGMGLVKNIAFIESISHLGITLLLFLAGLCLHPQKLIEMFKKTAIVTLANSAISFFIAFFLARAFHFNFIDSVCIGLALMFSSTILVVKLLPTTRLHHEKMGAICISVLILQDLLAIAVLALIHCLNSTESIFISFGVLILKLCILIALLFLFEKFVLINIMKRIDRIHEEIFILGLAWCFGIATISNQMGLFHETGAFFAGVVLARHKISLFISESLKPLRDFFLVLFFFALGAKLNIHLLKNIILPAFALTTIFLFLKPWLFKKIFIFSGEDPSFSKEVGIRLGQMSEFSLLIALLGLELGYLSQPAAQLIEVVTILTFIASSYYVVLKFPTPIGTTEKLMKD